MVQEPMVKRKKNYRPLIILGSVGIFFVLFITILINGWINLGKYSVYYAQNLPHKTGTNPVMVAVFNNTDSIYIPNAEYDEWSGGYKVRNEYQTIYYKPGDIRDPGYISIEKGGEQQLYLCNGSISEYSLTDFHETKIYNFSSNGTLVSLGTSENTSSPTIKDREIVNEKLKEMYGPIVSHRKVPKINLQFIYNFVNEGKFK
ncbi:hypothetical protein [Lactococcus lactis]|nr:hypothetical protein [Lactococcus lactis]